MLTLPSNIYNFCRATLLKCSEFDNDTSLRAMFVTEELFPFRDSLPDAASKSGRVDRCLDFLLPLQLKDGRPVLLLFLKVLRDRYDPNDARWSELDALQTKILNTNRAETPRDSQSVESTERGNNTRQNQSKMSAQIFICYAEEDQENVENLYQRLSEAGFKPWMKSKDLLPGQQWKLATKKAVRGAAFFLPCLSEGSVNKRGHFQKEIKYALDVWEEKLEDDIYLIPVRLEECELPDRLEAFVPVDLFTQEGFDRLLQAIQVGIEQLSAENSNMPGRQQTFHAQSEISLHSGDTQTASTNLGELRQLLNQRFDDPGFDAFCLDNFPNIYDRFGRGMRKDEKITVLLDACRRSSENYQKLLTGIKE